MSKLRSLLYILRMQFYDGVRFEVADRVRRCGAWIDREFDFYALNFAYRGRLEWRGEAGDVAVLEGPVLFWTWPGRRFVYGVQDGRSWDQTYVTYRGPTATALQAGGVAPAVPRPYATPAEPEATRREFDALLACLNRPLPDVPRAAVLLQSLYLHAQASPAAADPFGCAIDRLAAKVTRHPGRRWSAAAEADRLAVSAAHFRRLFSQRTHAPFHAFVIAARVQKAATMLRQSDTPVKHIADGCGFVDVYHFSKTFAARHGKGPAAYRREIRSLA